MRYSAGIIPFRINNTTKELEFFLGHPGGYSWKNKNYWAFMKGHVEEGEDHFEAALRELYEETSIDWRNEFFNFVDEISNENDVKDLGQHKYVSGKDLHLFYINRNVDVKNLKCLSFFEKNGRKLPEVNFYKVSYEFTLKIFLHTHPVQ